ncbi:MAG TPA: helix-turn-helix domain-containing protein, partial [Solirubrobacterales bacterium]|nr:helix-turn-helix domain-containing protein [Solirubrobacterales bacterium]
METQTGARRTRGRPSEGAREAVIEAARELFLAEDYDQVSTEQILDRSGVSRGALYHHFPSKLELFKAVYEASEQRLIEAVAVEVASASTPFEGILIGASAYLRRS